jgi:hypothetical protein
MTSYLKSRIDQLNRDHNKAHARLISEYLDNPINFTVSPDITEKISKQGASADVVYSLPYQCMSLELNKVISFHLFGEMQHVRIEKIYLGCLPLHTPALNQINSLVAKSLVQRCKWLIHNMKTVDDIDVIADLPFAVSQFRNIVAQAQAKTGIDAIPYDLRRLVKELATRWINQYIMENTSNTNLNEIDGLVWLCEYTNLTSGKKADVYDWWNTDPMFDELHEMNMLYFSDGYNDQIVNVVIPFILGFVNAWKDRQVIEQARTKTTKVRNKNGKKKKVTTTIRTLKYDASQGNMVTTIAKPTEEATDAPQNTSGRVQCPHTRRGTDARIWVSEANIKASEIIIDEKVSEKTGKKLCLVIRPRKEAKIKGGGNGVKGIIKAIQ